MALSLFEWRSFKLTASVGGRECAGVMTNKLIQPIAILPGA